MLNTSSMPLYRGEYAGVYAYRNPSSDILFLISFVLWTDKLSITNKILSKGYLSLISYKNILNFILLMEFLYIYTRSTPYSLETAAIMAWGIVYVICMSIKGFVFINDQACVGIVLFVTMHSSNYIILKPLSLASYTLYANSTASYRILWVCF